MFQGSFICPVQNANLNRMGSFTPEARNVDRTDGQNVTEVLDTKPRDHCCHVEKGSNPFMGVSFV